ncbi:hypothetical protein CDAR_197751 [Caerostris darwini]|uniref:Uncharacterized protein n=1 Tax=Caerostris darwini TaxID=1538125 RepID=A0AAV4SBN6_9ARAC|nr:hypothetical protein CDAR_197751 [Caerostris darwini]
MSYNRMELMTKASYEAHLSYRRNWRKIEGEVRAIIALGGMDKKTKSTGALSVVQGNKNKKVCGVVVCHRLYYARPCLRCKQVLTLYLFAG